MRRKIEVIDFYKKKALTSQEKQIITFLDKSPERDRTKTHDTCIRIREEGLLFQLVVEDVALNINPIFLISLVGKHLIKITFGRVKLDTSVYYRRSHSE